MAIKDIIRQKRTPFAGSNAGKQSVVDFNLYVEGVLYVPSGSTDTFNGGKERDGAIRLTEGVLTVYYNETWRKQASQAYVDLQVGALQDAIDSIDFRPYQLRSEKNQANGYAGLGEDGLILPQLMPAITPPDWGNIGGNLEDQDDLQAALNTKAAKTTALTINGVTQDISTSREWTITGGTGVRTVKPYSAYSGQTEFYIGAYEVGTIDVYLNGVRLLPTEYNASNGTTVVFPVGLEEEDIVEVIIWNVGEASLQNPLNWESSQW